MAFGKKLSKYFGPHSQAEWYVLLTLLICGGIAATLIPIGAGPDEETHMIRVWELSLLQIRPSNVFVPNNVSRKELPLPAIFWDLSYRRLNVLRPIEADFFQKHLHLPLDAYGYIEDGKPTRSVYSPAVLLPQAITVSLLGRIMDFPALPVFYAARLAGLLCYISLAFFALRVAPYGKWCLAILATLPTTLFNVATINAEAISNGITLVFISSILALATKKFVGWREWGILAILVFFLCLAKVNSMVLVILPFMIIRPSYYKMKHGYLMLLIVSVILIFLIVIGWNIVAYAHFPGASEGANPYDQIKFVLENPLSYLILIINDVQTNGVTYLKDWVAVFGYEYWHVPLITQLIFGLLIIASPFLDDERAEIEPKVRYSLGVAALFCQRQLEIPMATIRNTHWPRGSG